MALILGIESSCDETAAAVVSSDRVIHANIVRSQVSDHLPYGGVVPEIAARAHIEWVEPVIAEALAQAGVGLPDLDAVAVTAGPGLIGGVMVGVMTAKALCLAANKPLIAVNHLEGHALTARLTNDVSFPYLLLLVSGGHCLFAVVRDVGDYQVLGTTRDDALGEAFDKCAKMLGLPYPGGPALEALAQHGNPLAFEFPSPMVGTAGCDFSFSGLKTAIRYCLRECLPDGQAPDSALQADVAASFQRAVLRVLTDRTDSALRMATAILGVTPPVVVAGGVAANQAIGGALRELAVRHGSVCVVPPPKLCTDNAAMIAWAGLERFHKGWLDDLAIEPRARWSLSELSSALSA